MNYDVKDLKLAAAGLEKIEWAERRMPVYKRETPERGTHSVLPARNE
jgi:S-adenosylhomocysteine hydrolase